MPTFDELLNQLRNPGDDGPPETIYDDIASTYNHDVTVRDSKISESEQALLDRESEISRLKSANYDLMMSQAAQGEGEQDTEEEPEESEDITINDLFE